VVDIVVMVMSLSPLGGLLPLVCIDSAIESNNARVSPVSQPSLAFVLPGNA
jgi:hypothetical protein